MVIPQKTATVSDDSIGYVLTNILQTVIKIFHPCTFSCV
jgi:hypothetical protein